MQPAPELCGPWFSGISGGAWWVQDYEVSIPFLGFPGDTFEFETGFGVNLTPIGYRLSDTFSLSLEVGYHEAETDALANPLFGSVPMDGQLRLAPAVINANFNFPITDGLSIYLTVGAGVAYRELEASFPLGGFFVHDSGWNAIAQARTGVMFEVGECSFVNVGYRYQHVFSTPDDIQGHMVEAGYTWTG